VPEAQADFWKLDTTVAAVAVLHGIVAIRSREIRKERVVVVDVHRLNRLRVRGDVWFGIGLCILSRE
jgi:hypothetical protein